MEGFGERLRALAPHYLAMIVLILAVLWTADFLFGRLSTGSRLVLAAVVALSYPIVMRQLGLEPEQWS